VTLVRALVARWEAWRTEQACARYRAQTRHPSARPRTGVTWPPLHAHRTH
jgi:hypothetical protein